MKSTSAIRAMLGAVLFLMLIACAPTPPPTPGALPANTPLSNTTDLCANPFFPVVQGASWTYASTGAEGLVQPYSFTDTVTAVRADGFTITSQFADLTRTLEWSCTPEGLVALQLGGGPAGGLSTGQMKLELSTSNVSGVTIPAAIAGGQSWTYALDFTGNMEITGQPASAEGTSTASFTAIGAEEVTVPAGTFQATKVQVDTVMNILATYQGLTVPVQFVATSLIWFAPGVGWVKVENSGDIQGTQVTETITLQSYSLP